MMKRFITLLMVMIVTLVSMACTPKHVSNVPDDNQAVEVAIHNAGVWLEQAPAMKTAVIDAAIKAYDNGHGSMSKDNFTKIIKGGLIFEQAFYAAHSALLGARKSIDYGESVNTAALNAAIEALKTSLKNIGAL